jgi:hypothetical protein
MSAAATATPTSETGRSVESPNAPATSESRPGEVRAPIWEMVATSTVRWTNAARLRTNPNAVANRMATPRPTTCERMPSTIMPRSLNARPTLAVSAAPTWGR